EASCANLGVMENALFAHYGLSRFLLLYLVREALDTDSSGKKLTQFPSEFLEAPQGRKRIRSCVGKIGKTLVRLLDAEIGRQSNPTPYDFKRELKSANSIRDLRSTVISQYLIAVDGGLVPSFSDLWKKSKTAKN